MGLPTANPDDNAPAPHATTTQSPKQTTADNTDPTPPPPSPSALPPAALDLAAKLFDLARTGSTQTLTQYLTAGIPPNLTNSTGDTLLMLAAYHGHHSTVHALLHAGADPNVLNQRGQSPLAGAVFKGHEEVVRVLFAAGAQTDLGRPSAVEAARMFRRGALCALFGVEMGEVPPGGIPGAPAMG